MRGGIRGKGGLGMFGCLKGRMNKMVGKRISVREFVKSEDKEFCVVKRMGEMGEVIERVKGREGKMVLGGVE